MIKERESKKQLHSYHDENGNLTPNYAGANSVMNIISDEESSMATPPEIIIESEPTPVKLDAPVQVNKKKVKDRIVVLDKSNNLPDELLPNMVYWIRCETRVEKEDLVTNSQLLEFYREEFMHHEDNDGSVAQVSD